MNIFVVTVDPAAPPISGAELRNWQNASTMAELGHVTLISLKPVQREILTQNSRIEIVALSEAGEKRTPAIARRTTPIDARISRSALNRLLRLVEQRKPDIVIVEGIPLFPLLRYLRSPMHTLILDMHNIESDVIARMLPRFSLRNILRSDATRLRQREQQATHIVDRIWVCSAEDRARLRAFADIGTPVDIVPNGIPRPDLVPALLGPPAPRAKGWPVMLLIGHLGYAPNVDAAHRLATSIFPQIRVTLPNARLLIAGRFPNADVRALVKQPDVELIENPADIVPLYARAHFAVVPLAYGGGTRIKILEAMAFGIPVIATSAAAEGLDFKDGEEILISDTDAAITHHICALVADPVRYGRVRQRAFETVNKRFGRAAINEAVHRAVQGADR